MSIKKKIALVGVIVIAVLILLSATLLPWIVRSQAVKAIEEATGRIAHIDKVAFNPFTLTTTISGFGIEGKDASPFVSIRNLRVSLDSASLFKRALIVDEVTVDAPSLSFARLASNSYNFSDIIERQQKLPKKESQGELLYSINNINIHNGSIDFDDRAVNGGRKHTVRKLEIGLPFISNMPYLLETYTDPKLSAVVNDAPFSFSGKTKPLSESMETSVNVRIKEFDLPRFVAYSPVKVPVELASGSLTIDTEVTYKISANKKPELNIRGLLQLDDITINRNAGAPLLKIPLLQLNAARLEFFAQQIAFDSILLDGLEVFASRDQQGQWMYTSLLPTGKNTAKPPKDAKTEPNKLMFSVASLAISNSLLHFSDALPTGGFKTTISEIDLSLKNLSNAADKKADYEFSMLLDNQASLAVDGTVTIDPLSVTSSLELDDLKLQKFWPYLAQLLTAPVKGTLAAKLDLSYGQESGLDVKDGSLSVKGLSTNFGVKEGFELALLEVKGAGFNQKNQRGTIDGIKLSNGSVSLSKEADGSISLLSLLRKKTVEPPTPSSPNTSTKTEKAAKPLTWALKRFQLDRFNASFTDKSRAEHPTFTLTNSNLALSNVSGPDFKPIGIKFSSIFNKQAPLKADGLLTPLPFRYQGKLSLSQLRIRDFEDYFPETFNFFIIDGSIDTALNLDIALKDGKPTGSFKGNCGVRSFHSIDAVAEEDLLKWESLQFDKLQGTLEPLSLGIREVALNGVYSRIIIRKDGTLNLQNLVDKPEQPQPDSAAVTKEAGKGIKGQAQAAKIPEKVKDVKSVAAVPATKPSITIGAVTIQEGTISFSDHHLSQTFNSTFYNLGGRVSGLSSEDTKLAEVDLRGNLENHSPMQITGRINPLREDLFVDLKLSFKDIDLSSITPYSGTYLGYTVEKGKLFLDLKYLIDKKMLSSENNVFIDQFTFGTKVESDKATNLPVRLAVALLKDRKGEIHLDLPVTGRTDDPKFSIWGVVWQVVKNLFTKAVTSPFSLLSSMIGGGQDFSSIQFALGSSRLNESEKSKLAALAKALADRPGLKMEIKGYVEREKDTEGYRLELLDQKLQNEKFLLLAKERRIKAGETVDSVTVLPEETSKFLKAVYKKEKFPKPRNVIGLVKDLPDNEMRKLIITNTVVGEVELQKLARERATAVMDFLVSKGGLPPERLFQKNDDIHKAPEKESTGRSRVEFNAIAQ